jgi:hypothetical protein
MPIPLGVLAVAGAGGAAGGGAAYELLETVLVGSGGQSSIEFTSLNSTYGSTYQHLQLRWTARNTGSFTSRDTRVRVNGSSSTYAYHYLTGNGSSVTSSNETFSSLYVGGMPGASATANIFSTGVMDLLDAFETTKNKTTRTLAGRTGNNNEIMLLSGLYISTNAIDSISIFPNTDNFAQYSRFSLYGMRSS